MSKKCFLNIFKCLSTALELSMYTLYYLPRYLCACSVTKSCLTLSWTIACQAALTMGFSRQEYWSELPFSSPEDLPNPGIELRSSTWQADSLPSEPGGNPTSYEGTYQGTNLKFILEAVRGRHVSIFLGSNFAFPSSCTSQLGSFLAARSKGRSRCCRCSVLSRV